MDGSEILRAVAALGVTLALVGLCAWLVQKFGRSALLLRTGKSSTARLGVVEWRPLDGRNQLFLIRRDTTEHLVILSPSGQPTVVERNIRPAGEVTLPPSPSLPVGAADPLSRS